MPDQTPPRIVVKGDVRNKRELHLHIDGNIDPGVLAQIMAANRTVATSDSQATPRRPEHHAEPALPADDSPSLVIKNWGMPTSGNMTTWIFLATIVGIFMWLGPYIGNTHDFADLTGIAAVGALIGPVLTTVGLLMGLFTLVDTTIIQNRHLKHVKR